LILTGEQSGLRTRTAPPWVLGFPERNAVLVVQVLAEGSFTVRKSGSILSLNSNPNQENQLQMRITKKLRIVALAALSLGIASVCSAQSDAPYTEGLVWAITMVQTKPGLGDEYLKGLAKTFKGSLEEAKKQNLILDYKILLGTAATPQDFDILLMVESKNMAAFDNAREKFDPIARKIVGTTDQQQAMAVKRLDIREIMGSKLMREITLK
jgi:hypothetical protein